MYIHTSTERYSIYYYDCDVTCVRTHTNTRTQSRQHVRERVCQSLSSSLSFRSCASDSRNQLHSKLEQISTFPITLDCVCVCTHVCVCVCVVLSFTSISHTHHDVCNGIGLFMLMEAKRVSVFPTVTTQTWSRVLKIRMARITDKFAAAAVAQVTAESLH